ncbi:MAG: DUF1801 domain-containing protein [Candidatus Taylorbacteria bacterium]
MKKYQDVNSYIASYPKDVQVLLKRVRATIRKAAPKTEEGISYGMPAYKLGGISLVYFAAFKNHIGFYATPRGHAEFAKELSKYKQGKGSVQFPINKSLPLGLISKIVKFKVKENIKKAQIEKMTVCSRGHTFYKSSNYPKCPKCWPGYYTRK